MSLNLNPESDLVSENDLRAAMRCHQINAANFEAGIRERIQVAEAMLTNDPLANAPQLMRVAAALLPIPITGKVVTNAVPLAYASGLNKMLGYLAMPAITLFVLPAVAVFGAVKIHQLRKNSTTAMPEQKDMLNTPGNWPGQHKRFLLCLLVGTLALAWIGATSVMLLLYLLSLCVLLYVLKGLAKLGLANRNAIGQSCVTGLFLLGQASGFAGIGDQDIHFVDQSLILPIFFVGALILLPFVNAHSQLTGWRLKRMAQVGLTFAMMIPLIAWFMNPILWPATPERIKRHVESFNEAPFSSVSWRQWEIVASWAIESKLDPDLSSARRLLAAEIAGEQNPFILGSALRVGLIRPDQLGQLRDYDQKRHFLLDDPSHVMEKLPILSLEQEEWVIRASALRNDLSLGDRDYLEKRLYATLENLQESRFAVLDQALRVTQLLEVIQRPIDPTRYRDRVHQWLLKFHSTNGGGFQLAGGFRQSLDVTVGSVEETARAVQLMQIYGIPDGLDLNWVRSFLRPRSLTAITEDKWIVAVSLERLNRIPGATNPTWFEIVYYERSLIMAVLLVALCIYATLTSPLPDTQVGNQSSSSAPSS